MRANRDRVADRDRTVEGLQPRRVPDPVGAGGSSLTWFAEDAPTARRLVAALRAEGAPAAQMYEGRPVYENPAVQNRKAAERRTRPLSADRGLVARTLTVGIGPAFTVEDCEAVAAAVRKVARHVLQ